MGFALEIIGTIAFAISGAFVAINKKMDILGVIILAMATAVGGGIIRDLVLGITPPAAFTHPVYALVSIVVAILVFIPVIRRRLQQETPFNTWSLRIMDSLGLGVFTIVGIGAAITAGQGDNYFLMIFVGVVTGVGGGVLRDVMAGEVPYIFVRHFYASSSLIGAVCFVLLIKIIPIDIAGIIGVSVIFILRLLAAKYRWSLPRVR